MFASFPEAALSTVLKCQRIYEFCVGPRCQIPAEIVSGPSRSPNLQFSRFGGCHKVLSGRKWAGKCPGYFYKQLLAEIRCFPRHPKSENLEFLDYGIKIKIFVDIQA